MLCIFIIYEFSSISRVILTMCLAANTPSTIAQQKAATTPKLMKTMEATNCERKQSLDLHHQNNDFIRL